MGIESNRTHDSGRLLSDCQEAGIEQADAIGDAERLSAYAVETRYPGEIVPVTAEEAEAARRIAADVRRSVLARLPWPLDE